MNQYRALCQKLGDAATDTDIAKELGWSVAVVQYVRECSDHQQMISLDALQVDPDSDILRGETLAIESKDLDEFEISYDLAVLLARVPYREAVVIREPLQIVDKTGAPRGADHDVTVTYWLTVYHPDWANITDSWQANLNDSFFHVPEND